jgi:hypothetical protein
MLRGGSNDRFQHTVTRVLCVLSAIDFNDQASLMAHEINDETSDRRLTPKAHFIQTMPAKC